MKFGIATLGCKVNTYESNVMIDLLKKKGYEEVKFNDFADIYIVNTCTVTNTADSKSIKVVRQAIKRNENAIIIVVGCLVQNQKESVESIDGVDIIIGNKNKTEIVAYIEEFIQKKERLVNVIDINNSSFENMQLSDFNQTRAFVKIQDGCNNYCTYCIIPYTRGNVCSKPSVQVLDEIKRLVSTGHKEIVLTGIHTANYGVDLDNYEFANLLEDLVKIKGLERIRISSIEITEINDKIIDIIKNNDILVDHMHIPLQSGSNAILKLMNRKYDTNYFISKIEQLRKIRPNISITTDVIVGFPSETDIEFNETIETIKKVNFTKLHVFPYSKRNGTPAAVMDNQVDELTKKKRVKILMEISKELETNYMNRFIGAVVTVLPEVEKDGYLIGHTGNYLLVKAKIDGKFNHDTVKCKIESINYPYLMASLIDTNN
jgi:threonylcarbamoyladenosine tRNA methylthiotransferase MtaB